MKRRLLILLLLAAVLFSSGGAAFAEGLFALSPGDAELGGLYDGAPSESTYRELSLQCGRNGTCVTTGFVYSDRFLLDCLAENSGAMSAELAKVSVGLSAAAYVDVGSAPNALYGGLQSMGFTVDQSVGNWDRLHTAEDNDFVRYVIAEKDIPRADASYRVYCVVIQGTTGSYDWDSDFNIGTGEDHAGFYAAREEIVRDLGGRMAGDGVGPERTVLWTTGHSRGAAVSNIVSGEFAAGRSGALSGVELSGLVAPGHVFSYNFACPAVSRRAELVDSACPHIFNFNSPDDIVPVLPLEDWGYARYGTDQPLSSVTSSANFRQRFRQEKGKDYEGTEKTVSYLTEVIKRGIPDAETANAPSRQTIFKLLALLMKDRKQLTGAKGGEDAEQFTAKSGDRGEAETVLACARMLIAYFQDDGSFGAIADGHDWLSYLLFINELYYGYKGWYGFQNGDDIETRLQGELPATIGAGCFENSGLTALYAEGGQLKYVGAYAFSGCSSLRAVTFPTALESVGAYAFSGCANLAEIVFAGSILDWVTIAFASGNDEILDRAIQFRQEGPAPDFASPAFLERIGDEAFRGCGFVYAALGENVTEIGDLAFADCPNLRCVYVPATVASIGADAFRDVPDGLILLGPANEYVMTYAREHGLRAVVTDGAA